MTIVLLVAAQVAHAEVIVLACKRVDLKPGLTAIEFRFKVDLSAGSVTNLYGAQETVPAQIAPTSITWQGGSIPGSHHIDRSTGHFSTVLPNGAGFVEMSCQKVPAQGF